MPLWGCCCQESIMKLTNIVWHQSNYDRSIINNSCREMFWNSSQVVIQEQRMGMVLTHGSNAWDGIMQCSFYIRIRFDITGFIYK